MHESAERRARWSQSEVALHNQTNGLRSVNWLARGAPWFVYMHCTHLPVGYPPAPSFDRIGCVRVFSIFINIILLLFWIWFDFNLHWAIRTTCLLVFSVGGHIRVWILLCFIILFYLAGLFRILICPKGFLFWPLVGTEKIRSFLLAPGWYRESLICIIFWFFHFTSSYLLLVI
jgi:hypothetical protein